MMAADVSVRNSGELLVPVDEIRPDPRNARRDADDELAASIAELGVIQPLVVVADDDGYMIVAGERRWRGAKKAGLDTVPVVVRSYDDLDGRKVQLVENLKRRALAPSEEGRGYLELRDDYGLKQAEIAEALSVPASLVSKRIRILALPDDLLDAVDDHTISLDVAYDLARVAGDTVLLADVIAAWRPDAPAGSVYSLEHLTARALAELDRRKRRDKLANAAEQEGLVVIDHVPYEQGLLVHQRDDAPPCRLGEVARYRDVPIDHDTLDCHAVTIDLARQSNHQDQLDQVCTDPSRHPLKERTARDLEERTSTPRTAPTVQSDDPELAARIADRQAQEERFAELTRASDNRRAAAAKIVANLDDWDLADGLTDHLLAQLTDRTVAQLTADQNGRAAILAGLGEFRHGHQARTALLEAAHQATGHDLARLALAVALVACDPTSGNVDAGLGLHHRRHLKLLIDRGYRPCGPETAALEEATDG